MRHAPNNGLDQIRRPAKTPQPLASALRSRSMAGDDSSSNKERSCRSMPTVPLSTCVATAVTHESKFDAIECSASYYSMRKWMARRSCQSPRSRAPSQPVYRRRDATKLMSALLLELRGAAQQRNDATGKVRTKALTSIANDKFAGFRRMTRLHFTLNGLGVKVPPTSPVHTAAMQATRRSSVPLQGF
jgi:hypothetical protein